MALGESPPARFEGGFGSFTSVPVGPFEADSGVPDEPPGRETEVAPAALGHLSCAAVVRAERACNSRKQQNKVKTVILDPFFILPSHRSP